MKILIPLICCLVLATTEPPVGDGYPSSRSGHDHSSDFQRSPSQEYGAPSSKGFGARIAPSQEYGAPNSRFGGISQEYGAPGLSQNYDSPGSRGLSQEYGTPNGRNGPSQQYGAPSNNGGSHGGFGNGLSQEYGAPNSFEDSYSSARSSYNAPDSLSSEYGAPSQRSSFGNPSQKYGAPNSRGSQSNSLSRGFKSKGFGGKNHKSFGSRSSFGSRGPSQSYGAPSRSPSSQYGLPDSRARDSYSQGPPSQSYGAPDLSSSYQAPNARGLSQEYGAPSSRNNHLKTGAFASSFGNSRSSPSQSYGPPSGRNSMPSDQYGPPDQNSLSGQGYGYSRNGLDDENQEPANYDFQYQVNDYESGSEFGHSESRQDNRAEGTYFVVLPDGTKQTVEYEADERGFKPRISVEPIDGGYDENASDNSRSGGGPY